MTRQQRYQARHKAQGLCVRCPNPARPGYVHCEHCYPKRSRENLKWDADRIADFKRRWNDGESAITIAADYGTSIRNIYAVVHRLMKGSANAEA